MKHALSCTFVMTLGAAAFAAVPEPVKVEGGLVTSTTASTPEVHVFKGIPYAAPPVGNLRWRAPKPAPHWEGVRKGDEFGASCMQGAGSGPKISEDCLYLNVWTAAKSAADKLPVMVWLHGGGNYVGSGSGAQYDGALATKGAVVVTLNFRVGPFGFFAHPELTKESDRRASGNYGMMDQIAALQWVQKNIAAFGGDPKNITLFGESAGAQDVSDLMASPQAKGLFQRVIGESSSWTTVTVNKLRPLADAEQAGVKLADGLGAKIAGGVAGQAGGRCAEGGSRDGRHHRWIYCAGGSERHIRQGQAERCAAAGGIEPRRGKLLHPGAGAGGQVPATIAREIRRHGGSVSEILSGGIGRGSGHLATSGGELRSQLGDAQLGPAAD